MAKETQREKVLKALRMARSYQEGVTGDTFLQMRVPRYSARIAELRDEGFKIATERVKDGLFRFRLEHDPDNDKPQQTQLEV